MLTPEVLNELVAFLRNTEKKKNKPELITVALAYSAPIMVMPEDSLKTFPVNYAKICEIVSCINEEHLVPVQKITDGVRKIYICRAQSIQLPMVEVPEELKDLDADDLMDVQTLVRLFSPLF